MLSINRARAKALDVLQHALKIDVSKLPIHQNAATYFQGEHSQFRIVRLLVIVLVLIWGLKFAYGERGYDLASIQFEMADVSILNTTTTTRLPHIPPKIWQTYLSFDPAALAPYKDRIHSWVSLSPSYSYTILDTAGALSLLSTLSTSPEHKHVLSAFYTMTRRVLRADFLRYLLLALEGGIYSDIDTELVRPISNWVPEGLKEKVKLIVGIEADASPPVGGTYFNVQFCQWTIAASKNHPVLWRMVDKIIFAMSERASHDGAGGGGFSNHDILTTTGPAGWTDVLYGYLSEVMGETMDWGNLTGMREPRLYGDVLVLPIDGFAAGVPHSGASKNMGIDVPGNMVAHYFDGTWKHGD